MRPEFELFLFTADPAEAAASAAAGIDGVVVDWERRGKHARQAEADTEINYDTAEDLQRVRAATGSRVVCRINGWGPHTPQEVATALDCGADEVLLPMVRGPREVEEVLQMADGRVEVSILVETVEAVSNADELGRLPISRAYVGLNDLAIERGTNSIFAAVADGTVEKVRRSFRGPFGFGGLTLPDRGDPIPCALLIAEMARLRCSFGFLRRSYRRDVGAGGASAAVAQIRQALRAAAARPKAKVDRDHSDLLEAIEAAQGSRSHLIRG